MNFKQSFYLFQLKIDYENFRSEMNGHFDTLKTMISSLQNGQDLNAQYPSELVRIMFN